MPAQVLVAEDNLTLRWLFVQLLEKLGVECECAANGSEAIKRFKKRRGYSLILMDVMMPGVDGYEATKQIREFERVEKLGHVPIIGVTCVEDRHACLAAGMDEYYRKPIEPEQMKEIVEKWLLQPGT